MSQVRQLGYWFVYLPFVNRVLRNVNRILAPLLPASLRIPPSGVLTVKLKSASFRFATNQTNTTSQLLFWKGPYNIEYTTTFEDLVKKCKCFFDVGAHAGYYSLVAASVNKSCQAVAFEPASGPFHYLEENIRINGLQGRVTAVRAALGGESGTAVFLEVVHSKYKYLKHNLVAVGNLASHQPNRVMKNVQVDVTTLDEFVSRNPSQQPDLIKIDTEGTEHLILAGADRVLLTKPIVISETLFNSNERELESLMARYGYEFFNYKDGKLWQVKSLIREVDDGVHDCFFVHPDKRALIAPYVTD
jgi:FkbM family methyltransferase